MKRIFSYRLFLLLTGLLVSSLLTQAQYLVKGTIYDSATKEILSYAPVVPLPSQKGTLTNGEGYFELRSNAPVKELQATYMGYKAQTVAVPDPTQKDQRVDVFLVPLPIMLQEVEVSAKRRNPEDIIKALYESLKSKASEHHYAEGMIRSYYTDADGIPYLAMENVYLMDVNQSGIGECRFMQGRMAQSKDSYETISRQLLYNPISAHYIQRATVTNFSPSSEVPASQTFSSSESLAPISAHPGRYFEFKMLGVRTLGDETVSIITFQSKKAEQGVISTGRIEIIENMLQIVSLELNQCKGDRCFYKSRWTYNNSIGGWQLERIDFAFNPPPVPPFNVLFIANYHLYIYNHDVTPQEYQTISPEARDQYGHLAQMPAENIQNIRGKEYDPTFWEKRKQVFSEIPFEQSVQQSIVSSGFYGNLFSGGMIIPRTKIPGCSALQNSLIEQVVIFYRHTLSIFLRFQLSASEVKIIRFFNKEVRPLCEGYIDKVARGEVSEESMQKTLSLILMEKERTIEDFLSVFKIFDKSGVIAVREKMDNSFGGINYRYNEWYLDTEKILY